MYIYAINTVPFLLTVVYGAINSNIPTKTNIAKIYVYASEPSERA